MPNTVGILETDSKTAVCDGGGGPLGHSGTLLQIGNGNEIECSYFSQVYQYRCRVLLDTAN